MGQDKIRQFWDFVLEKLADEPLPRSIGLYETMAGLLPDEQLARQLREDLKELRLLRQKFKNLRLTVHSQTLP